MSLYTFAGITNNSFVHRVKEGRIDPAQYYRYLTNFLMYYYLLETQYNKDNSAKISTISQRISHDLNYLEVKYNLREVPVANATESYIAYIHSISNDRGKLLAHVYANCVMHNYINDMLDTSILFDTAVHQTVTILCNDTAEVEVSISWISKVYNDLETIFVGKSY